MAVLIYIQARAVNTYTPAQILAPLTNKFDAITTYQAGNAAAVTALFAQAQTDGYDTYLWVSPGYVPAGMPAAYWGFYPTRWTSMQLAAARTWIVNYWTALALPYHTAGVLSGLMLDYIRYPLCAQYNYPPLSSSDIDTVVQSFRSWTDARSLDLVASVFRGQSGACSGQASEPMFDRVSQDWPNWCDQGWIDRVFIMSYTLNNNPAVIWANQPTDPADLAFQRPLLDPAGTGRYAAPTESEWNQELTDCDDWGYPEAPSVSVFDWDSVQRLGLWDWILETTEEPPIDPPDVTGLGYVNNSAELHLSGEVHVN
jgi:hypothetical protein